MTLDDFEVETFIYEIVTTLVAWKIASFEIKFSFTNWLARFKTSVSIDSTIDTSPCDVAALKSIGA